MDTHTTLRNASFNLLGYIYPMFLAFIVAPITVNFLGVRDYGLYLFIVTTISVLGILDFGISVGVNRFITKYNAQKETEKMQKLSNSANTVFFLIGLMGLVTFLMIAFLGNIFISETLIKYENYHIAFILAGILFFITSANTFYSIVPNALRRFDLSNKIGFIIITLQQIGIVTVILLKFSIITIFIIQIGVAIMAVFLNRYISNKILPNLYFTFGWDKYEIKKIFKFGFATFVNNLAGSSLTYFDKIIIPILLGPSNLTYYSLAGNISSKTPGLAGTLASTLFPLATHFDSLGDSLKIKKLYERSTRLILVFSTAITVTIISFPYQILFFWINKDVADKGYLILIILAITGLFLSILSPISNLLLGIGKLKLLTKISVLMSIINILLLIILIPKAGILGAAWAYLISVLPIIILIYEIEKKYLQFGKERFSYYVKIIIKLSFISLLIYLLNIFILKNLITNLFTLLLVLSISLFLFILFYKIFNFFEKEDITDIQNFVKRIIYHTWKKDKKVL